MNTIDHLYYINLDYRTDRRIQMEEWLEESGFPSEKVTRMSAVHSPGIGHVGCGLSHILTLDKFLESGRANCLILEDDYIPIDVSTFWDNFKNLQELHAPYDIMMCSYNMLESEPTNIPWIHKVHKSYTTSGYLVTRDFAPKLRANFMEAITNAVEEEKRTGLKTDKYCIDVYWQQLMPISKWYCFYPRIGKQSDGFSDIQQHCVDYVG
jgi:hypothetical protein